MLDRCQMFYIQIQYRKIFKYKTFKIKYRKIHNFFILLKNTCNTSVIIATLFSFYFKRIIYFKYFSNGKIVSNIYICVVQNLKSNFLQLQKYSDFFFYSLSRA